MRVLAPGKINLCLFLGPVRPQDDRHELVTLFESLSLADELDAVTLPPGAADRVRCRGVEGPNLAATALSRLRETGWEGPPLAVEIAKRVPVAAGMGGGSADAAAVLRLAAELAPAAQSVLREVAVSLGADVPAQLTPGAWLGTGAGELLERPAPIPPHALVILPLPHALATPAVYREADRLGLGRSSGELARWRERLLGAPFDPGWVINDLQPAALSLCPEIAPALEAVHGAGADTAVVCGSGPTVAGVMWGGEAVGRAEAAAAALAGRWPRALVALPVQASFAVPTGL